MTANSAHSLRTATLLRSTIVLTAMAVSAPAMAQDSVPVSAPASDVASVPADTGDDNGTITVTARRRVESAQDIPVALSVVSADTLNRSGNFTLGQIQQLVPSLQVQGSNPRNTNVNIRGLGANSSIAVDGLEYGVGFYVDGVYYARPGQAQFDLVDLDRVEVLRGPQGTLFGKNTSAGAINITTREPSFTPEGFVEGWLGDYEFHQVRASVSAPIIDDKLAFRLSVADTHRGGFATNIYDNSDVLNYDNFTVRGQLLAKPTDNLKIKLIGDYSSQQSKSLVTIIDGYYARKTDTGALITNSFLDRAARFGYTPQQGTAFRRTINLNSPVEAKMKSYGVSGEADLDLGRATLTSVTAYRWWDWEPQNDIDGTPLSVQLKANTKNYQRQFSQELRLASNGKNKVDYVLGLYYFWQVIRSTTEIQNGADYAAWNIAPTGSNAATIASTAQALTNFQANSYSDPSTKSYAAFGQADWHITDALTLTAGLRYTHEDKLSSLQRYQVAGSGLDLSGLSQADRDAAIAIRNNPANQLSNVPLFVAKVKDDAVSGLVSLSYKVTPDILVYGSYSHGGKSGGLNVSPSTLNRAVVQPEKVDAFELGLKSQFLDRRATVNLALFQTDVSNYQANVSEPDPANANLSIQYISNIPKVRSQGVEADINYAPSRWINFTASAAYVDAKYISYIFAPQAADKTGLYQNLSGVRLPNVSKFTYTLSTDVAQPVTVGGAALEVYGRADFSHRSSFNASGTNSIYSDLLGYGTVNGRIGLRTGGDKLDVSFWVRNLTNAQYYTTRAASNIGLITAYVSDPRTFGATARVRW